MTTIARRHRHPTATAAIAVMAVASVGAGSPPGWRFAATAKPPWTSLQLGPSNPSVPAAPAMALSNTAHRGPLAHTSSDRAPATTSGYLTRVAAQLPHPFVESSPHGTTFVNLETWLWVDRSIWHVFLVPVRVDGRPTFVTAVPAALRFSTGDGTVVSCVGPGAAYDPGTAASSQSTTCDHTYQRSSSGSMSVGTPDAFALTATVTFEVSAPAGPAATHRLGTVSTSTTVALSVAQIESVVTA